MTASTNPLQHSSGPPGSRTDARVVDLAERRLVRDMEVALRRVSAVMFEAEAQRCFRRRPGHLRLVCGGKWLVLAGELLVTGAVAWLVIRGFRSAPWPRCVFAGGLR